MNISKIADQIKAFKSESAAPPVFKPKNLLSTGSTLLNLACSGDPFGGFLKGHYYWLVGDSSSGKTFFSMTCFAEALRSKQFKDYRLIYDNVEDGMLMDVERLFGRKVAERIEPPSKDEKGRPRFSFMVEEFYYHLDEAINEGHPFIYVLDSLDSLSSKLEVEKFDAHKKAHYKGTKAPGSYGDGKAKKNSEGLRKACNGLRKTKSILIVISQTRDSLGFGFETKTHSGGRALRFYATVEIWSSVLGSLKTEVNGKKRKLATEIGLQIKKNRLTGKLHKVQTLIYPSYGIDDIGSCIDYLVDERWWKKNKGIIEASEFGGKFLRDVLIQEIEKKGEEDKLRSIVGQCWNEIEKKCDLNRKPRYE